MTGRAPLAVASPKFTEPLRDTPQSIDVVTSEVLADQGATTLRDAVRNVAGISLAAGEGGAQGDNLTIRGFTARNDIFIDGMRDFGSYYRDPFNQEQVQVLKGPSSVAFGRGTTGGVLNQATKTPERESFVKGTANLGTDLTERATLDVNEPMPALGDGAAFRLNVMAHDARTSPDATSPRISATASRRRSRSVSATPTRATFTFFHQAENDMPDYGIPWLFNAPAPVARSNYYGFADTNFLDTRADIAGAKVEHQFGPNVSVTDQVRYANYGRHAQITEAQMPASLTLGTPLDAINVDRNQITVDSTETFLQNQFDVTSRFRTGARSPHAGHRPRALARDVRSDAHDVCRRADDQPACRRIPSQAFAGTPTVSSHVDANAVSVGVYALDTVSLGEQCGRDGRRALGSLRRRRPSVGRHADGLHARRREAELARRRRLQAGGVRQRLRGLRHVVQSVGRSAVADRGHRQPAAGEQPHRRGRQQVGSRGGTSLGCAPRCSRPKS